MKKGIKMNRRSLLMQASAVIASTILPMLSKIPEATTVLTRYRDGAPATIKVWHRYSEGMREVIGTIVRFDSNAFLRGKGYVADVFGPGGGWIGLLDKAGRYIPQYDLPILR
jgi:hypothetical protein